MNYYDYRLRKMIISLIIFLTGISSSPALAEQLFDLTTLGENLARTLKDLQIKTVAVAEFACIDGTQSTLGKLIAEEVTTGLFNAKNINIIERTMLEKILNEQKLQLSGLTDQNTANRIGILLGADALIIGTWADMGETIRINARIVSVTSGNVSSAVAVSVPRTEGIKRVQASNLSSYYSSQSQQNQVTPINQETAGKAGAIFYREDFLQLNIGEVPLSWGGTDNVILKELGSNSKNKILTTFQPGPVILRIPDIKFPDNFSFCWKVSGKSECSHCPNSYIKIGNLQAGIYHHHCTDFSAFINKSQKEIKSNFITNVPKEFKVEKKGSVFRLLIDGTEELIIRYPDFKVSDSIMLFLSNESENRQIYVNLHSVEGVDLGD